jgi:peroxiredoxin Q/BCP
MSLTHWVGAIAVAYACGATAAAAQAAAPREQGPAVGQAAPDFGLVSATRGGVGKAPVRLADFRGKTVVLAFFYKARTKG